MQILNEMLLDYDTLISGDDSVVSRLKIEELVSIALKAVYKYDKYLIDIMANERCIVFRFGYYFQTLLSMHRKYNEYDLDLEYNRDGEDSKKTPNHEKGIYPDVILHKRGNNNDNLLVMEFKGHWNNKGQEIDKNKIHDLMNHDGKYKYKNGYIVFLDKNDFSADPIL